MSGAPVLGTGLILTGDWAFVVFISAADRKLLSPSHAIISYSYTNTVVMVLRVYAMWNRSKIILGVLLSFYVIEVIIQVVCTAIFDNPNTYSPGMVPSNWTDNKLERMYNSPPVSLAFSDNQPSARLFGLLSNTHRNQPLSQIHDHQHISFRRSITGSRSHTHHEAVNCNVQSNEAVATQPVHGPDCQGGYFLHLLVRHSGCHFGFPSILLFHRILLAPYTRVRTHKLNSLACFSQQNRNLLNNITNVIEKVSMNPLTTPWLVFLGLLGVISLYPVIPRFILGVRELYDKDSRGRCEGIDTGFGVSSRAERNAVNSAIAFADVGGDRDLEGDEEIQLEQVGDGTR